MTDAEINLAIAKLEYPESTVIPSPFSDHKKNCAVINSIVLKDYVNNWSDIGEIIEREKIDLAYDLGTWSAYGLDEATHGFYVYSYSPTKAACLCYLHMKKELSDE